MVKAKSNKADWSAPEARIILSAMGRNGIIARKELSEKTGMKDSTMRTRMKLPQTTVIYELRSLVKALNLSDAEIIDFVRGVK